MLLVCGQSKAAYTRTSCFYCKFFLTRIQDVNRPTKDRCCREHQ
ncbi:unnamed protein product [Spirodela intermedia]|uniref:Uncharacterized protein n=2 Tax=Spirodela intermedia TaxID=51605 RepID=A0A7I8K508_SPIIN|nr:unnamed protein product [Spirodela intermedia]CAA6656171.1 unnamed protein product [Spirodela intermedia]CAA7391633.1 unnamed protein product [Spirodela intermedia]